MRPPRCKERVGAVEGEGVLWATGWLGQRKRQRTRSED